MVNIKTIKKIAESRDGRLLSSKYKDAKSNLEWRCNKGHIWKANYSNIKTGTWCPYCAGRKKNIKDLINFAKKKAGNCLSKKYEGANKHHIWKCKNNHIWNAKPSNIFSGKWCPYCVGKNKSLKKFQEIAKKNGGECLSKEYRSVKHLLSFKCKKKHIWTASPRRIEKGGWCLYCEGKRIHSDQIFKILRIKQGKCLSKIKNITNKSLLKFKCKNNHKWNTRVSNIIYNKSWCPDCEKIKYRENKFKEISSILKKINATCISKEYLGIEKRFIVKCARNHQWVTTPRTIINGKSCPQCEIETLIINRLNKMVNINKGKYFYREKKLNYSTILNVTCKLNHKWRVPVKNLIAGSWCPKCARNLRKPTLKYLDSLAKIKGGHLISKTYINATHKLKWKCKKGHIWLAIPSLIKRGAWCPECLEVSLEDLNKLAKKRGGICLQKKRSLDFLWQK